MKIDPFTPERIAREYYVTEDGQVFANKYSVPRATKGIRPLKQVPSEFGTPRVRLTIQGKRRWFRVEKLRQIIATVGTPEAWHLAAPKQKPPTYTGCHPNHEPSPEEIAEECRKIREGWPPSRFGEEADRVETRQYTAHHHNGNPFWGEAGSIVLEHTEG